MPSVSPTTTVTVIDPTTVTVIDPTTAILAAGKYQLFAYVHTEALANFVNDVVFLLHLFLLVVITLIVAIVTGVVILIVIRVLTKKPKGTDFVGNVLEIPYRVDLCKYYYLVLCVYYNTVYSYFVAPVPDLEQSTQRCILILPPNCSLLFLESSCYCICTYSRLTIPSLCIFSEGQASVRKYLIVCLPLYREGLHCTDHYYTKVHPPTHQPSYKIYGGTNVLKNNTGFRSYPLKHRAGL